MAIGRLVARCAPLVCARALPLGCGRCAACASQARDDAGGSAEHPTDRRSSDHPRRPAHHVRAGDDRLAGKPPDPVRFGRSNRTAPASSGSPRSTAALRTRAGRLTVPRLRLLSRGQIFLMPGDGGTPRPLSQHATPVSDIAWHPDGTTIYFIASDPPTDADRERLRRRGDIQVLDEYRQRHLWKIAVADGKETRITGGDYYIFAFKIAANGQRIIFSRRPTPLPSTPTRWRLWSIAADGSAPHSAHEQQRAGGGRRAVS